MSNPIVRNSIRSLADFASQAPHLYTMVNRLGEQRRRQRAGDAARQAGFLAAGLVLGAGLTTLLTPRTGAEVRRRVSDQFTRVREYIAPRKNGAARRTARNPKELS